MEDLVPMGDQNCKSGTGDNMDTRESHVVSETESTDSDVLGDVNGASSLDPVVDGELSAQIKETLAFRRPVVSASTRKKLKRVRRLGHNTDNMSIEEVQRIYDQHKGKPYGYRQTRQPSSGRYWQRPAARSASASNAATNAISNSATPVAGTSGGTNCPGKRSADTRTPDSVDLVANARKRGRMSYRSVLAAPTVIKVAVIPTEYPDRLLTEEEADKIQAKIIRKIMEATVIAPRYDGCRFMDGMVGFKCLDEDSKVFLEDNLSEDGFKVVEMKDLPPRIKAIAYTTGRDDPGKFLSVLQKQNVGLNTSKWRILRHKVDERGGQFILAIDAAGKEYLERCSFSPCYLLSRIAMRILQEKEKEEEKAEPQNGDGPAREPAAQ